MQTLSSIGQGPPSYSRYSHEPAMRTLAGITVPDTPLVSRAIEYARNNSEPYLFNHVMRSWLFAVTLAKQKSEPYDAEVLAVATLLHDLGLTKAASGPLRFEMEGANSARDFVRREGLDERRAQLVWDSIALNSTPSICLHMETEAALCTWGLVSTGADGVMSRFRKPTWHGSSRRSPAWA